MQSQGTHRSPGAPPVDLVDTVGADVLFAAFKGITRWYRPNLVVMEPAAYRFVRDCEKIRELCAARGWDPKPLLNVAAARCAHASQEAGDPTHEEFDALCFGSEVRVCADFYRSTTDDVGKKGWAVSWWGAHTGSLSGVEFGCPWAADVQHRSRTRAVRAVERKLRRYRLPRPQRRALAAILQGKESP